MSYEILQKFISKNRSGKTLVAKGTVVHETATPGATAENEFKYFNTGAGGRSASAHAFIDYDCIIQTVPWNEQAWHAGGTANRNYIGIEFCNYDDATKFQEIWKRAVWLFAWVHVNVLKVTNINKDTLMSHAEVSAKWKETNHQDPVAYFAKFGKTVDMFRAEVQAEINSMLRPKKYYVVTNYIPAGEYGIEINSLKSKYFSDLERIYMKSNPTGMWIETQYLSKEAALALADLLNKDNLLYQLVEE
jgi:N-acetylmuramoyl-L-alanine amidase